MRQLSGTHLRLFENFAEGYNVVRRTNRFWGGLWTDLVIEQVMMKSLKSRGGLMRGRGMTESVHHNWIYSMHKCASVHEAMCTLTQLQYITSEQHVELGQFRCERDIQDCEKILHWIGDHNPFDLATSKLRSLTTGPTARSDDDINCDRVEEVGTEIQKKLDNSCFTAAYGICCIVFNGYEGPSIKDHEHKRRTGRMSAEVTITETAIAHKYAFFSNSKNKSGFIAFLAAHLRKDRHCVSVSDGDADTQIVSAAIAYACNGQSVVLVADDRHIHPDAAPLARKHDRCCRSQGRAFSTEILEMNSVSSFYSFMHGEAATLLRRLSDKEKHMC